MLDKCSSPKLYPSYTMSFHLFFLLYVCVWGGEFMCLYMYVYMCGSLCMCVYMYMSVCMFQESLLSLHSSPRN